MDPITASIVATLAATAVSKGVDALFGGPSPTEIAARMGAGEIGRVGRDAEYLMEKAAMDVAAAGGGTSAMAAARDQVARTTGAQMADAAGRIQDNVLRAGLAERAEAERARAGRNEALYNIASAVSTAVSTNDAGDAVEGTAAKAEPATVSAKAGPVGTGSVAAKPPVPLVQAPSVQGHTPPSMQGDPLVETAVRALGITPPSEPAVRYPTGGPLSAEAIYGRQPLVSFDGSDGRRDLFMLLDRAEG